MFELRPVMAWDKGRAVWWLCELAGLRPGDVAPIYIGDDETDEDAFAAVADAGVGIVVGGADELTVASLRLRDPEEVWACLDRLAGDMETGTEWTSG